MPIWKKASALFAVLLLTVTTTACALGGSSKTETVRVAEVTRSIFYAPFYAAIAQGFFEEEGIELELTTAWGGDKAMTALLSDGADISLVGAETTIYVYAQEAADPAVTFAALTQTDGTFLVSREKLDSFSWEDLKGSTFLGQRKGGMPQMVGEHVLKKNGIDPHNDLTLIQSIDFGNIPSAFASGTGDFVQLFEPQATLFENEGLGHIIASFGTESGSVPYTGFIAKQSMLDDNPETLERFTRALYKGQQWVEQHPAEEVAEAIIDFFEDTPVELIAQVVERYHAQGSFASSPIVQEEAWDNLHLIMEEAGELPQHVDYDILVDTSIAEKVIE
ncbi:ABC transporter substrate-binding protein [Alkalihalobacillus oceani]|uniref:ABC transporter substrate-binding protein n=1 Tax=Halalkalibacter oceani TaxID=1653776 RepID=UPI00203AF3A6|nr:ABC transporter substrate-binding protein [Halalkalibacter oceani]MCM3759557.1 ABC transporter substrate-binding protein [Halalkalibacter oceani]